MVITDQSKILLKEKVIKLRELGKTYPEINNEIGFSTPKSTLSYWCKNVKLADYYKQKIKEKNRKNLEKARNLAKISKEIKKNEHFQFIINKYKHLGKILNNRDVAKIALAMLYLGEGSKINRGSLMFGNSNPNIVYLFLYLLRKCYDLDESKFRCTLQCRADQNIQELEQFWSKKTNIPLKQFYKARIDPRTIGMVSKNKEYKGVCRIDYFSANINQELNQIAKILYKGI